MNIVHSGSFFVKGGLDRVSNSIFCLYEHLFSLFVLLKEFKVVWMIWLSCIVSSLLPIGFKVPIAGT